VQNADVVAVDERNCDPTKRDLRRYSTIWRFQVVENTRFLGYVCNSMRLRITDSRERMIDALLEATGENTKSKAIDTAIAHYCACAGDNVAQPQGTHEELMQLAIKRGSLTPQEIAQVLDTDSLPVKYNADWSVGE